MNRVKRALAGFDETKDILFVSDEENFVVTYYSEKNMSEEMKKEIESVIVAQNTRKFLGQVGDNKKFTGE